MCISKQLLALLATLLAPVSLWAQGVFTSPSQLSTLYSQEGVKDSARSSDAKPSDRNAGAARPFPITYLEKAAIQPDGTAAGPGGELRLAERTAANSSSKPVPVDPIKDSLQFLRYIDSLASVRVTILRNKEARRSQLITKQNPLLNRLRDVPSILPYYIAASRKHGRIRTRMSSGFGMRQHPILGSLVSHAGIDLPALMGTLVYATADGFCRQLINQPSGIGIAVYLSHGRGHQTLYGHLLSTCVKPGDFVLRGQVIGWVGASGLTTGPHLHYGVRYNGQVVDPLPYCFLLSKPLKPTQSLTRK